MMNKKGILSIVLVSFYFIIGVATSQAPRQISSNGFRVSPVNINDSKHILYFDNFNTNKNNWPEGRFDSVEYYFDNGKYVFDNKSLKELSIQNVYPNKTLVESKDWIFETEFSIKYQEENGTTYLLWGKSGFDFEGFGFVQENGKSYLWHGKRVLGVWKGKKLPVNHYTKNNSSIILSVHKVKDRLNFYINKRLKFSKAVTAFAGNEMAIAVEGQTKVSFHDVTVKQLQFLEDGQGYSTDRSQANFTENNNEVIIMRKVGGDYLIPIYINGKVSAQFAYDQWTADVVVSEGLAERLIKSGTVTDWIGDENYKFKNKSITKSSRFVLNTIKVGKRSTQDVECMIVPNSKVEMLIGTAVLSKLGKYKLDSIQGVLIFEN